jgi:4-hydroxy-4-methyl-2-oxoglutarate aldolase
MTLTAEMVAAFRTLDTCTTSNVIETFKCRLRNEGFTDGTVRSLFGDLPPVIGHAVTARIRNSHPPPVGYHYFDRTDWWNYVLTVPPPRLLVVQDTDDRPGLGAFLGEVHANILRALGCVGYATNGSVRDINAVHALRFPCFAAHVAVSHAYAHLIDFGEPVTIGGLTVASGDILHGDRHGLVSIPPEILPQIPEAAQRMLAAERQVIAACQSPQLSLDQLRTIVRPLA